MPYTADGPGRADRPEVLRDRIPGWGADLHRDDRPAFPREQPGIVTGAHWEMPEQQIDLHSRERSVEHERLTPVFGTAQPLRGVAGGIRRFAYRRYSEGQTAHWLLLVLGDRVDAATSHAKSVLSTRPDDPITQSGLKGEWGRRSIASRLRPGRIDMKHAWLDPVLIFGPWVLTAALVVTTGRALLRLIPRRS